VCTCPAHKPTACSTAGPRAVAACGCTSQYASCCSAVLRPGCGPSALLRLLLACFQRHRQRHVVVVHVAVLVGSKNAFRGWARCWRCLVCGERCVWQWAVVWGDGRRRGRTTQCVCSPFQHMFQLLSSTERGILSPLELHTTWKKEACHTQVLSTGGKGRSRTAGIRPSTQSARRALGYSQQLNALAVDRLFYFYFYSVRLSQPGPAAHAELHSARGAAPLRRCTSERR
jgi:hypothetical protein